MNSITTWVLSTFTSPAGVFVLALLDSTMFFSLPFGIDAAVIILSARTGWPGWLLVPVLATGGSLAGASLTFWMGRKAGEKGLDRYLGRRQLDRARRRIDEHGAVVLAAIDLIPPPFPFTPFVVAAGALGVRTPLFFATLVIARLLRFGVEAILARTYGRQILWWLESDLVQNVVFGCIVLGVGLTAWTLWRFFRSRRRKPARAVA
jgi:membrane protein DedA with SNARE-associated domain